MFLHDQLNGSFTWAEFFLALLISISSPCSDAFGEGGAVPPPPPRGRRGWLVSHQKRRTALLTPTRTVKALPTFLRVPSTKGESAVPSPTRKWVTQR